MRVGRKVAFTAVLHCRLTRAATFRFRSPDTENHALRFVSSAGLISIAVGAVLGVSGYGGDGFPATSANVRLSSPTAVVYQSGGGLVVGNAAAIL